MISWHPGNYDSSSRFSIIIPTWNNLPFLKICIASILRNSAFSHQLIIHVNEGTDGTLEWVRQNQFSYTYSDRNTGVCWAMNACRSLVRTDYIAYLNDDMYMLPGWDSALMSEIGKISNKYFFLSSTTIEPRTSPHPGILAPHDFGSTPETFREEWLLQNFKNIKGSDWHGATWPPNIVHKDIWDLAGGYSVEYYPGLYSDPDFSMKLYEAGVRYFKGIDASRAYHFGSKTTGRLNLNKGSKQFLNKWGITAATFSKYVLRRGQPYTGKIEPDTKALKRGRLKSRLKRLLWCFGGTGKAKGRYSF
jgi:glycosyltransferase involved in cell wall biosynthesis